MTVTVSIPELRLPALLDSLPRPAHGRLLAIALLSIDVLGLGLAFALAYMALGYSFVNKGEFEKAIEALEKYLQLEPDAENRVQVESDIQQMRDILASPPPVTAPCCQPPEPGKGVIWFENHVGETVQADVGPNFYEIPPKQGDVAGCLSPQLDPGHYAAVIRTGTHEGRFDIDIVAGQTLHFPLSYEGY